MSAPPRRMLGATIAMIRCIAPESNATLAPSRNMASSKTAWSWNPAAQSNRLATLFPRLLQAALAAFRAAANPQRVRSNCC